MMRPRGAIRKAFPSTSSADPLRRGLTRTAHDPSSRRDRRAGAHQPNQPLALAAAESSISMKKQLSPPSVATPTSRTLGGLVDITATAAVNNVSGNYN